jgi:hypothetical protein
MLPKQGKLPVRDGKIKKASKTDKKVISDTI